MTNFLTPPADGEAQPYLHEMGTPQPPVIEAPDEVDVVDLGLTFTEPVAPEQPLTFVPPVAYDQAPAVAPVVIAPRAAEPVPTDHPSRPEITLDTILDPTPSPALDALLEPVPMPTYVAPEPEPAPVRTYHVWTAADLAVTLPTYGDTPIHDSLAEAFGIPLLRLSA